VKPTKSKTLLVGVVYFLILLGIAVWVRDIPLQFADMPLLDITPKLIIQMSSMGDPGTFANAAIDMAEYGWISQKHDWVFNLWPPGFVILEALIIKVFGINVPLVLALQVIAAALFAFVLMLLYAVLRERISSRLAILLPLAIFLFPVSRAFLLEPVGITLGESFAIGFFLSGVLLSLHSVQSGLLRYAVGAGFCLALSAYFRSQFEFFIIVLTGIGILYILLMWLVRFQMFAGVNRLQFTKRLLIILLVAHVCMAPWRMYHWIYHNSPQWLNAGSYAFSNYVKTTDQLRANQGGFVVDGGGNLPCLINADICGDTHNAKQVTIKIFLEHPVEWYAVKVKLMRDYWFSSVTNWVNLVHDATLMELTVNLILLATLISAVFLQLTRRVRNQELGLMLLWVNISLVISFVVIFTLIHLEVRYFYFLKILGFFMFMVLASLYWRTSSLLVSSVETDR
jgi:hypothetical protein